MESFSFDDFLGLARPYSYQDERVRDPIARFTYTFDPLTDLLPHPLLSDITASSSSASTNIVFPGLTEEEAAHVDNLVFFGVDSPVLPPNFLTPPAAATETPLALKLTVVPNPTSTQQTASSVFPLPASCTLSNPTTACVVPSVSPPALKRRFTVDERNEPQEPSPGPSDPRPSKRPCFSYPGESSFQLDPRVAPLEPTKSAGQQPIGKPSRTARTDYSACRCLGGQPSNEARHWRACPYNPDGGEKRFKCEQCPGQFTRQDNKLRHVKKYH